MTDVKLLQQEDLNMFGALILQLCAGSIGAMNNIAKAAENLGRNYSSDLKNVALFLITKPGPHKVSRCGRVVCEYFSLYPQSIGQVFDMIGSRLLTEFDEAQK